MNHNATILVTFLLLASTQCTKGQESDVPLVPDAPRAWVLLGLGSGYFGPTLYAGGRYESGSSAFTLRYTDAHEFQNLIGVENNSDQPELSFREYGVMYGRILRSPRVATTLSAGIGYATGMLRGVEISSHQFEPKRVSTITVPFELGVRADFSGFTAGISAFGILNHSRSFAGFAFLLLVQIL